MAILFCEGFDVYKDPKDLWKDFPKPEPVKGVVSFSTPHTYYVGPGGITVYVSEYMTWIGPYEETE